MLELLLVFVGFMSVIINVYVFKEAGKIARALPIEIIVAVIIVYIIL